MDVCLSVGLSAKLVSTIQTESFQLGLSYLVHILYITWGWRLGQGHTLNSVVKSCKQYKDKTKYFGLGPSNLVHILVMARGWHWFSRSGVKGQGHRLNIVVQPCKQDKDRIVHIFVMAKGCHLLIFKVMGQRSGLTLLNLVNKIKTESFGLGSSNFVQKRIIARGWHLLIFTVKGQGHRLNVKPCKQDKDEIVWVRTVKHSTHTYHCKMMTPIGFQGQGSKVKVTHKTSC